MFSAPDAAMMLPVHKVVALFAPCTSELFAVPVKLKIPGHDDLVVSPYVVLGSVDACPFGFDSDSQKRPSLRFGPPLDPNRDLASQGFQSCGTVHLADALRMYADHARSAYLVEAARKGGKDLAFACDIVNACDAFFRQALDSLCTVQTTPQTCEADAKAAEISVKNLKSLMCRLRHHSSIPCTTSAILFADTIDAAFERATQTLELARRRSWAARTVQKHYLHAYYCPEHPLCQKRLLREFLALGSACMGH